jgi:hypothetical protein
MSEKIIVGLFDSFESAKSAIGEVTRAGIAPGRISLLANDSGGHHPGLMGNPAYAREEMDVAESQQSRTVVGFEVGVGLGGVLGLLAGVGTIVLPGIGALLAAGAWATIAAGAAAGGVVGGVIGAMTDHGISSEDAHLYAEGLKRGGTLVTVKAGEDQVESISAIFKTHHAADIGSRRAEWVAEGWISFNPDSPRPAPTVNTSPAIVAKPVVSSATPIAAEAKPVVVKPVAKPRVAAKKTVAVKPAAKARPAVKAKVAAKVTTPAKSKP